jgi:hypothetical protein
LSDLLLRESALLESALFESALFESALLELLLSPGVSEEAFSTGASEEALAAEVRRLTGAFFGSRSELASGFWALAVFFGASGAAVATLVSEDSAPVARLERRTGLSCWISSMFLITHFYAANCRCVEIEERYSGGLLGA